MPEDAAQRFGRSAPLDAAAAERAELRVEENDGVACPPWWLPPFMATNGQALSGNQVAHVHVDDGKPHCDLMSHQSAGEPKPAESPSHALPSSESSNPVRSLSSIAKGRVTIINSWTIPLLCAFVFVLSVYAFEAKVPTTPFLSCVQRAPCASSTLLPAPYPLCASRRSRTPSQLRAPHYVRTGPGA